MEAFPVRVGLWFSGDHLDQGLPAQLATVVKGSRSAALRLCFRNRIRFRLLSILPNPIHPRSLRIRSSHRNRPAER